MSAQRTGFTQSRVLVPYPGESPDTVTKPVRISGVKKKKKEALGKQDEITSSDYCRLPARHPRSAAALAEQLSTELCPAPLTNYSSCETVLATHAAEQSCRLLLSCGSGRYFRQQCVQDSGAL